MCGVVYAKSVVLLAFELVTPDYRCCCGSIYHFNIVMQPEMSKKDKVFGIPVEPEKPKTGDWYPMASGYMEDILLLVKEAEESKIFKGDGALVLRALRNRIVRFQAVLHTDTSPIDIARVERDLVAFMDGSETRESVTTMGNTIRSQIRELRDLKDLRAKESAQKAAEIEKHKKNLEKTKLEVKEKEDELVKAKGEISDLKAKMSSMEATAAVKKALSEAASRENQQDVAAVEVNKGNKRSRSEVSPNSGSGTRVNITTSNASKCSSCQDVIQNQQCEISRLNGVIVGLKFKTEASDNMLSKILCLHGASLEKPTKSQYNFSGQTSEKTDNLILFTTPKSAPETRAQRPGKNYSSAVRKGPLVNLPKPPQRIQGMEFTPSTKGREKIGRPRNKLKYMDKIVVIEQRIRSGNIETDNNATKQSFTSDELVAKLKTSTIVRKLPIVKIIPISNGRAMIYFNEDVDLNEMIQKISQITDVSLLVREYNKRNPFIALVGVDSDRNPDEVGQELVEKNTSGGENNENGESSKSSAIFRYKRNMSGTTRKIIYVYEVPAEIYNQLKDKDRVKIAFQMVNIRPESRLVQCYKCCGFGHRQKHCPSPIEVCGRCCGNHPTNKCSVEDVGICCPNCKQINLKKNPREQMRSTSHSAFSNLCPELKKAKILADSYTDYGS